MRPSGKVKALDLELTSYEREQGVAICMSARIAVINVLNAVRNYCVWNPWPDFDILAKGDAHDKVYSILEPMINYNEFYEPK